MCPTKPIAKDVQQIGEYTIENWRKNTGVEGLYTVQVLVKNHQRY